MQMSVFPSSGGLAPVAPMLFPLQLTLTYPKTGCGFQMFPGESSE